MAAQGETKEESECCLIEDVEGFVTMNGVTNPLLAIKKIENSIKAFKEANETIKVNRAQLLSKKNDLKFSVDLVGLLKERRDAQQATSAQILLCDNVYAPAVVPPTDKVIYHIGSKTMVEMSLDEAVDELKKDLAITEDKLAIVEKRIDFMKRQLTTLELNLSVVTNYIIVNQAAAQGASGQSTSVR